MYTQTSTCPKCGAPIYVPTMWHAVTPPPSSYSCNCRFGVAIEGGFTATSDSVKTKPDTGIQAPKFERAFETEKPLGDSCTQDLLLSSIRQKDEEPEPEPRIEPRRDIDPPKYERYSESNVPLFERSGDGTGKTWICLEHKKLAEWEKIKHGDAWKTLGTSPYDIPAYICSYTCKRKYFVIELEYINSEPTKHREYADRVKVFVGRNSGRIYKIQVDLKKLGTQTLDTTIYKILDIEDTLASLNDGGVTRKRNISCVKKAIDQTKDRLFS